MACSCGRGLNRGVAGVSRWRLVGAQAGVRAGASPGCHAHWTLRRGRRPSSAAESRKWVAACCSLRLRLRGEVVSGLSARSRLGGGPLTVHKKRNFVRR